MRKAEKILWAIFFLLPFLVLNSGNALANPIEDVDETPDVTARVARISFLRGAAQIRHADSKDWERATQNLPIVEGDEISTDGNARLEIQFNRDNFLRLSENSYLKITTLRDEGVAVSLPEGKLSLRVLRFDKDRASFEIDAPQTTVAVEQAGMYRVDAGDKNGSEVRVSVTDDGKARIYSENSAFTLRSGRSAQIQISGNYAGEWETADASKYADEFDSWALQRDTIIVKRLQNAGYDKYYDNDFYGAEDLSEYGEWIHTRRYGYVWKPFSNATSSYANWSPYRYGHWRWIPPYGWTWVNDESWGWATYHHGRWVYVDNNWAWTPYGQHRPRRSWWQPALVVINYTASLICWYPLPYSYGYHNYNSTYIDRRRYNTTIINNNNTTVVVNPTQVPSAGRGGKTFDRKPFELDIPTTGVIAVEASEFGKGTKGIRPAPVDVAKKALSKMPFENENPPLPNYRDLKGKVNREILAENPRNERLEARVKTGATARITGVPVDENLRKEKIYGNRQPFERTTPGAESNENPGKAETRNTGAVKRVPRPAPGQDDDNTETKKSTVREIPSGDFPIRSRSGKTAGESDNNPVSKPRNRVKETSPDTPPEPQERQERKERRQLPPQPESPQRSEPPPKREEPREAKPSQREQPSPKEDRKTSPPSKENAEPKKPDNKDN